MNSKKCKLMLMKKTLDILTTTKLAKAMIIVNCGMVNSPWAKAGSRYHKGGENVSDIR